MKTENSINKYIKYNNGFFKKIYFNNTYIIILLILFVFSIRILGIYAGSFTPDSITYYDIAQNIKDGDGFKMSFRMNYMNDHEGIKHYEYENPPLYPLALALFPGALDSFQNGILFNVLLCAVLVVLMLVSTDLMG